MQCPTPINIKDPEGTKASQRIQVPCGRCGACRANKRSDWSFRLKQELREADNAYFVTLTYNDESLPTTIHGINTLVKDDFQRFLKRLRKKQERYTAQKIRYYAVGEYGTNTDRPHYHIIIFNLQNPDWISSTWNFGHYHIGTVTEKSIHYISKYHVTVDKKDYGEREPEFATMSRRPGIGNKYVERVSKWHRDNLYSHVMNNGYAQRLPRYYRDKIFSETEKKYIGQRDYEKSKRLEEKQMGELERRGKQEPEREIFERSINEAKKVKSKAKKREKNLF